MFEKQDYRRMLEEAFSTWREVNPGGTPENRVAFLGDYIFDFTTYDDEKSAYFASRALEVCSAISDGKTFEYINDPGQYQWYLLMVNMPFFADRIEWGTSVRVAWWDHQITYDGGNLWRDGEQMPSAMVFTQQQWKDFIAAVLDFASAAPNA